MRTISSIFAFTLLLTSTLACEGTSSKTEEAKKTPEPTRSKVVGNEPANEPTQVNPARTDVEAEGLEGSEPKPAAERQVATNEPSNDKEFLGLELVPMGDWKPVWDPDAKVAKWENDNYFSGIIIRVVSDKLESMDDLKAAAPMMMQVGTAISSVEEDVQKTDQGWWTRVKYDDGKAEALLYVRKFGDTTVVCSANLGNSMGGDAIKKEDAIKACESFKLKGT